MLIGWTRTSKSYKDPCKCPADFQHTYGNGTKGDCFNLDHFARVCPQPPFSRMLAEALYRSAKSYAGRVTSGADISMTTLTGDPLQKWLEMHTDYVSDPLGGRFLLRGSAGHEALERMTEGTPNIISELLMVMDFGDVTVAVKPDQIRLRGPRRVSIHDLKTQDVFALQKKAKETDEQLLDNDFVRDNVYQVNGYAVGCREMLGVEVERIVLEYWDGNFNVRELEAPIVEHEKMKEHMHKKALEMVAYLAQDTPEGIPTKDYSGWHPVSYSGIYYLYKEALKERAA